MVVLKILVTGGGSPGIAGTIYSLRHNYDQRDIRIICTDARDECIGQYIADGFYKISKANEDKKYLSDLINICKQEKIDIIIPQNTSELLVLSRNTGLFLGLGVKIIVSDYEQMVIANNKYELLKVCEKIGIPYPEYELVNNVEQLKKAIVLLGWPQQSVLVKPPVSNGSRGIRIIDENKDYKELYLKEKPTSLYIRFEHFIKIIGETFEPILAMEYLSGEEVTIDVFRDNSNFISIPRKRDEIRSGISFKNSAFRNDELIEYSKIISEYLNLQYCFGYQFKYDSKGIPKILECNPRVQGTMIFSTFMGANLIYSAVKSALCEKIPEFTLHWETKLLRYWGAVGTSSDDAFRV